MNRGVLYIVWGNKAEQALNRSIASVKRHHPELSIHVHRLDQGSLKSKVVMGSLSPFDTTLYLDADTVVLGDLNAGFKKAEWFGLACCICEAPWMRRYGHEHGDMIEYNTGVIFWHKEKAKPVMDLWPTEAEGPSKSSWTTFDNVVRGLAFDDQAGFARAVDKSGINPFVLPVNYNYRGDYFQRWAFSPIKVWHGYSEPPPHAQMISESTERGERLVTYITT